MAVRIVGVLLVLLHILAAVTMGPPTQAAVKRMCDEVYCPCAVDRNLRKRARYIAANHVLRRGFAPGEGWLVNASHGTINEYRGTEVMLYSLELNSLSQLQLLSLPQIQVLGLEQATYHIPKSHLAAQIYQKNSSAETILRKQSHTQVRVTARFRSSRCSSRYLQ